MERVSIVAIESLMVLPVSSFWTQRPNSVSVLIWKPSPTASILKTLPVFSNLRFRFFIASRISLLENDLRLTQQSFLEEGVWGWWKELSPPPVKVLYRSWKWMIPKNTLRTDEAQFDMSEIKNFFCKPCSSTDYCKICKATNSLKIWCNVSWRLKILGFLGQTLKDYKAYPALSLWLKMIL